MDDTSLLPRILGFGACFGAVGFTKASPTIGRGLEDLGAYVLLVPRGFERAFEVMLSTAESGFAPLTGREGFDGVVSTTSFALDPA